jgi:hypothetical protein
MNPPNNATAEEGRPDGPLAELGPVVNEAVAFAEAVPEPYRSRVFDLAYERLTGWSAAPVATPVAPSAPAAGEVPLEVTPIATGGLALLARELDVEPRALSRVVAISDEGKLSIIPRVDSRRNAQMQAQYSAMYAFAKERIFNQMDVPIEELRELCRSKSCYDLNNFTWNYKRSELLSPVGDNKSRGYRLTKKGVEVAKELLKKMVEA